MPPKPNLDLIASACVLAAARGAALSMTSQADSLSIDFIGVTAGARRVGTAGHVLSGICDLADASQMPLTLEPHSGFGADLRWLIPWYQRHGFTPVAGTSPLLMRRMPRMNSSTATDDGEPL